MFGDSNKSHWTEVAEKEAELKKLGYSDNEPVHITGEFGGNVTACNLNNAADFLLRGRHRLATQEEIAAMRKREDEYRASLADEPVNPKPRTGKRQAA